MSSTQYFKKIAQIKKKSSLVNTILKTAKRKISESVMEPKLKNLDNVTKEAPLRRMSAEMRRNNSLNATVEKHKPIVRTGRLELPVETVKPFVHNTKTALSPKAKFLQDVMDYERRQHNHKQFQYRSEFPIIKDYVPKNEDLKYTADTLRLHNLSKISQRLKVLSGNLNPIHESSRHQNNITPFSGTRKISIADKLMSIEGNNLVKKNSVPFKNMNKNAPYNWNHPPPYLGYKMESNKWQIPSRHELDIRKNSKLTFRPKKCKSTDKQLAENALGGLNLKNSRILQSNYVQKKNNVKPNKISSKVFKQNIKRDEKKTEEKEPDIKNSRKIPIDSGTVTAAKGLNTNSKVENEIADFIGSEYNTYRFNHNVAIHSRKY